MLFIVDESKMMQMQMGGGMMGGGNPMGFDAKKLFKSVLEFISFFQFQKVNVK